MEEIKMEETFNSENYYNEEENQKENKQVVEFKESELDYTDFYKRFFNDINFFNSFIVKSDIDKQICKKKIDLLIKSLKDMDLLMFIYSINNSEIISYIYDVILESPKYVNLLINIISGKTKIKLKKDKETIEYKLPYKYLEKAIDNKLKKENISPDLRYYLLQLKVFVQKAREGALCHLNDLECKMYYLQEAVEIGKEEIIEEIKKIDINPKEIVEEIKENIKGITDNIKVPEINTDVITENLDTLSNLLEYQKNEIETLKSEIFSIKDLIAEKGMSEGNENYEGIIEKIESIEEKLANLIEKESPQENSNLEELKRDIAEIINPFEQKMNDLETKLSLLIEGMEKMNSLTETLNSDEIREFIEGEKKALEILTKKLKGEEDDNEK